MLKSKGVAFEEIAVDFNPALRAKMSEKAGGLRTVPQIWIGDVHVGGCNELYRLERQGSLDPMLAD
jgi:glutaredoxin 3